MPAVSLRLLMAALARLLVAMGACCATGAKIFQPQSSPRKRAVAVRDDGHLTYVYKYIWVIFLVDLPRRHLLQELRRTMQTQTLSRNSWCSSGPPATRSTGGAGSRPYDELKFRGTIICRVPTGSSRPPRARLTTHASADPSPTCVVSSLPPDRLFARKAYRN